MAAHDRNFIIKASRNGGGYQVGLFERVQGNDVHIPPTTPIRFDKTGNGHKKTDYYRLKFTIQNGPNCDLRFLDDLANVMWVHQGATQCPTAFCEVPDALWTDDIKPNSLRLINADLRQEELRFTINLVDRSIQNPTPNDYVPLDPIVSNGNKGSPDGETYAFSTSSLLIGFGAGVAACLVGSALIN